MTAAELAEVWSKLERVVEEQAVFPPGALGASVWDAVAAGKVATRKGEGRAVGVGVIDRPRERVWLSLTDDTPVHRVEGLTEARLEGAWAGPKVLYQLLDLPWPIQDRHWALKLWTNTKLALASGVWERAWTLAPERLAEGAAKVGADGAVPVERNDGGWLLVDLGAAGTLGVYQARVDLGGAVPEDAARAYASATMAENFELVERNADDVARRYGAGCVPQPGGDGKPIPCFR